MPALVARVAGAIALACVSDAALADGSSAADRLARIFHQWSKPDAPGCALGVRRRGEPDLFRASGSADLEHGVPIGSATVFEAGSVSKQFTAASTLILVEQGKLALADDVRRHVPELPDYGSVITIAQLLGHTSGLRDWEGVAEIAGWPIGTRAFTAKDAFDIAARQQSLNHAPGAEFSYTNTGYILLAAIVERVSGESLARFSREHLFEPLHMTHTQWRDDFRRVVKDRAVAYDGGAEGYRQRMPFESVVGAGGLLTTVDDLLAWNQALDDGALGKFVTVELQRRSELADGRTIPYARGLYTGEHHGVGAIWHTGETAGYEAYLARYPDQRLSVALLCNTGEEANIDSLGDAVADVFLPAPVAPSRVDPAAPAGGVGADRLDGYGGRFYDPHFAVEMDLELRDGMLRRPSDGLTLTPVGPGVFRTSISTIRFSGRDRFVRDFDDGRRWEFARIRPWSPGAAELAEFRGAYRSSEARATYDIGVVDGHLSIALDDRRWETARLDPVTVDVFSKPHHAYRFVRDANGRVSGVEISNGWEHVYALPFQRVADAPAVR